jgi:hypothetical protein
MTGAPKIIGLTGLKGSGKDTAAQFLIQECGYTHLKMADGLKAMLRTLLVWRGMPEDQVERWIDGDAKEDPCPCLDFRTPRHAMQSLGTAWGRELMAPEFWVSAIRDRCKTLDRVVISDVRFPNEAKMVREMGGQVFRVDRPSVTPSDPHPSETEVLTLPVDGVLLNDGPTAFEFKYGAVAYVFRSLKTPRLL